MPVAELLHGAFSGPAAFAQRIRDTIDHAARYQWKQMVWADEDFLDWPLYERSVVEALQAWAGKGRMLHLLARRFDAFPRLHPRFVTWRQRWDHIIDCRICAQVQGIDLPSALWTPDYAVQRVDVERSIGWSGVERQRVSAIRAEMDECAKHSSPGFAATTLGL